MKPEEFVNTYLGQYKDLGDELNVKICPFCQGGSRKSDNQYKFYVNKETGAFKCYRENHCGRTGGFQDLAEHFNAKGEIDMNNNYKTPKKKYKKPEVKTKEVDKTIIKYLKARGFHEEIINQLPVKQFDHYNLGKTIAFMYYMTADEKKPTFIKYRNFKKKDNGRDYRREKDTKPILWNMPNIDKKQPVLITEGEFDAMAAIQSGFKNAVSIPSGVNDFSWVENCWEWLEDIDEFIIWGDNDKAGHDFEQECVSKLGELKCKIVEPDENYNDANEIMYKEGEEKVLDMILNAKDVELENIMRLSDVAYYDETDNETVTSGFKKFDKFTDGFAMGEISIWTGKNGAGKSTLIDQVLIEAINEGYNVCAFSGEAPRRKYRKNIDLQLASHRFNEKFKTDKGAVKYRTPKYVRNYIGKWYQDRFFLFDADRTRIDADKVLEQFEKTAKKYDCRVFLIDNLIKMNLDKNNFYASQSEFIDKCSVFAHRFNAHVHIVAHPRKTQNNVGKMDISGSGDITNLADNVFIVVNTSKNDEKQHDGELGILKHRSTGNFGIKVELMFDQPSLRFYEVEHPVQAGRQYGWEKEFEKEGVNA